MFYQYFKYVTIVSCLNNTKSIVKSIVYLSFQYDTCITFMILIRYEGMPSLPKYNFSVIYILISIDILLAAWLAARGFSQVVTVSAS